MKHTFTLPPQVVVAMTAIAPTADIRYYLNGIQVEVTPGQVILVATSGSILAAHRMDSDADSTCAFIMPIEMALRFKACGKIISAWGVTYDDETKEIEVNIYGETAKRQAVEGVFPDWRRVLPQKLGHPLQHYNPELLMAFVKYSEVCRGNKKAGRKILLSTSAGSGGLACVTIPDIGMDFVGVVMPYNVGVREQPFIHDSAPSWAA